LYIFHHHPPDTCWRHHRMDERHVDVLRSQ
jgi:hypothetical protein